MPFRLVLACIAALAVLAVAGASAATAATKAPSIRSITPKTVAVGDTLTIRGRNFLPGRRRTTVVFKADRKPAVFVKASRATRTKLTVKVVPRLAAYLPQGSTKGARFRVRVLARKFGRRWTSLRSSPVITGPVAPPDCDADGTPDVDDVDDDNDLLPDVREGGLGTNVCLKDSDGDGLEDGWEVESALDLNVRAIPYPGKRPYPNPLDAADAKIDFDGDGLTNEQEHRIWQTFGGRRLLDVASGGTQHSGGSVPAPTDAQIVHLDINSDGVLTDDERDHDGDMLSSWDEANGRMRTAWWKARYETEEEYPVPFLEPDPVDADTDGDGVSDGLDDHDHDGVPNVGELSRGPHFVHPFNPCLPDPGSRTCSLHPPFNQSYPPFDAAVTDERPLAWPRPAAAKTAGG